MLLVDIRLVVRLVIDAALPLLLHLLGRAAQDIQLALGLHHVGKIFTQHCLKAYWLAYHKKLGIHSAALSRLKVVMYEAIFTSPAIVTCLDCFGLCHGEGVEVIHCRRPQSTLQNWAQVLTKMDSLWVKPGAYLWLEHRKCALLG